MAQSKATEADTKSKMVGGIGKRKKSGIVGAYNRFLHSGKIFGAVTWIFQVAIEFVVIYGVTLMLAVYPIPHIINAFIAVASGVGRAEMFWIPVGFICVVLALVIVRIYGMLWHALNRWFGDLRNKRAGQLHDKYGDNE